MNAPSRLDVMRNFVATRPNDAFARYGLAMEQVKLGQLDDAIATFDGLLELSPQYTAAYYQAASALVAAGQRDGAKAMVARGVSACEAKGDSHARDELLALLTAEGL